MKNCAVFIGKVSLKKSVRPGFIGLDKANVETPELLDQRHHVLLETPEPD